MRTIRFTVVTLSLLVAQSAFAQSTETGAVTTGPTTQEVLTSIMEMTPGRVAKTAKQLLVPAKQQDAWEKESAMTRQRMAEQRAECRDIIRKSNRDERMPRILQCQRAMLLLDANLLRKQAEYIGALPLVDRTLKATATGAMANLEDAEMAIIDGIDTGLFEREEQLIAARNNLRTTYREPVWAGLMKVRIDRELTNLAYISKLLHERADVSESSSVQQLATCLHSATEGLQRALSATDRHLAGQELTLARGQTATCQELLRALGKADRQQEKN